METNEPLIKKLHTVAHWSVYRRDYVIVVP